ncbi:DUF899 domain-containing protein [Micromonospora sp. NPDC049282]|uniref:DUF899 domain-containing protein n=1 Tax=Micromonospora sp. NPDC049282 TaxID=3364269 RepID=UPI00371F8F41
MNHPPIVPTEDWQAALDSVRVQEKMLTRELDKVAAARRRLPMAPVERDYVFEGPDGPATLVDLFQGRSQLIVYTFMWHGAEDACTGCSMFADNVGHLAHLNARDVTLTLTSGGPLADLMTLRRRMGWALPWYSSLNNSFNVDMGAGDGFGLNVFLRVGDQVFRTYSTTARGVERLGSNWTFLDLTPYGRRENWEDSPEGWPQTEPYRWWRLHDEYDPQPAQNR